MHLKEVYATNILFPTQVINTNLGVLIGKTPTKTQQRVKKQKEDILIRQRITEEYQLPDV